ncbi:DUF4190 domain-containing protein [Agromyces tardus]|nr:DUF4190 domain-containing protein [Agromyces tardus]
MDPRDTPPAAVPPVPPAPGAATSAAVYSAPLQTPAYGSYAPPQAPGYGAPAGAAAPGAYGWNRPHNALAWVSLGLGIGFALLGTIASIAAVICGHIARRQIRERGEQGDAAAIWGLVLGYLGIAFTVLVIGFFLLIFAAAATSSGVPSRL